MPHPTARVLVRWSAPDPGAVDDPLLLDSERARCSDYRRPIDAARHATGRALARAAGAELLDLPECELAVAIDDGPTRGRPRLVRRAAPTAPSARRKRSARVGSPTGLHLSIAHGGEVVVAAVSDVPCGVDVELVESLTPLLDSDVAFSAGELAVIATAGPAEALELATRWWTAKEAVFKAIGAGLADDPARHDARTDTITVDLDGRRTSWQLTPIAVPASHRAMLATPGETPIELRIQGPTGHRHRVA